MRNVGKLRTFNPKLKDSAGGEVNQKPWVWRPLQGASIMVSLNKLSFVKT